MQYKDITLLKDRLQAAYMSLEECTRHDDMPTVARNAKRALACVWQILNNLGVLIEEKREEVSSCG